MSELLLSIPEAAKVLDKSATYIRNRIDDGTFTGLPVGKGGKRRKVKLAESAVKDHKRFLAEKEKEYASRRRKPKTETVLEPCLPAAQVEMFSGPGIGDLLAELKKTNEMLAEITKAHL